MEQRVINFITLVLHIIRLATDIMTPEGAMLPNYSGHCSNFSLSLRGKSMEKKIEFVAVFLLKY